MTIGASTSNLYPALTEEALDRLLKLGFRELEVFVNTESELDPAFIAMLREKAEGCGARILAVHPYVSGTEPYLLFSQYERRLRDGMRIYERIFAAARELGAGLVVMHGDKLGGVLSVEESVARFERLFDLGRDLGVTLAQENVYRFRSSDVDYIRAMRAQLGEKAHFVLDVKQARRFGLEPERVIDAMGDRIAHVHISDRDDHRDCLVPGRGTRDFPALIRRLQAAGFNGCLMMELYRTNFGEPEELLEGRQVLEEALRSAGEADGRLSKNC